MKTPVFLLLILAMAGCLSEGGRPDVEFPPPHAVFDNGRLFDLSDCTGIEVGREWVGPHGPNGPPAPPPAWRHEGAKFEFSWSLEVLECNRLGWGPLERGPTTVALEVHNAYQAPTACTADLSTGTFLRYIHGLYMEDSGAVDYASSWGLPAVPVIFSQQDHAPSGITIEIAAASNPPSNIKVQHSSVHEGRAEDVAAALFWFEGEHVHRLTLQRETHASAVDVAMIDMEAPTIMADVPGSTPAIANWLTNLRWHGNLVTFSDHHCNSKVIS